MMENWFLEDMASITFATSIGRNDFFFKPRSPTTLPMKYKYRMKSNLTSANDRVHRAASDSLQVLGEHLNRWRNTVAKYWLD